ncbi:MAG TPA: NAD-dependent epimerase/dehydratase family protein [Thermoleophilaceae bacterium]|nr:NAD-dependent epimerase/dehydratase family protein [Thermoleophilaceae bacterium]
MRVVVTGATGNVGTSVLDALARDPAVDSIVGVARRLPDLTLPKTSWRAADVAVDALEPIFEGADCVIHLAWLIQPGRDLDVLEAVNVEGSARVFRAVAAAGVGSLVYASSVGAYSPGPKDRRVDESWPTEGIPSAYYARQKAEVERRLDLFELEAPEVRVVRLRPALIFKRGAASEIRRLFVGPLLPSLLVRPSLIPLVPDVDRLVFQAVHSSDVGEAYRLAATGDARGPFNIAAEPVLDPRRLGAVLGAKPVPFRGEVLRALADVSWRLHLQPTEPGWVDMARAVPVMDTARARRELGWEPTRGADEALLELLDGIREGAEFPTPPLARATGGPLRVKELVTGIGSRT